MTDEIGQQELKVAANALVGQLSGCEAALDYGEVQHMHHTEFAGRVRSLGLYLRAALQLAGDYAYPQAFAMLRCAVEHRALDDLIFLGDRFEQVIEGVDNETWERWQTARSEEITQWKRTGRRVRIVWPGLRVRDANGADTGYTLSIYYRWWKQYDPIAIAPRAFDSVASGFPARRAEMADYEAIQREIWSKSLAWQNLKYNLQLHGIVDDFTGTQVDLHYRFLSAFVHPASERVLRLAYPRNSTWPTFDHYSEELVLLYVCSWRFKSLRRSSP
jgi:hypothetical protein